MAFNWFRRPNNESADTPENQSQEETPAVEATEPETTAPDTADLLAFAKAAYKNIQEKQQLETELSVAVEEDTISQEIVETQVGEITAPIEIDATIAEITEDVVNELQPEPELANLSFLERAAAERQAKQEKLIASAIETEIPEIQITPTAPEIEIPELVFDDGFKWSAKVLAAQGRKAEDISLEEITWLKKLRQGLDKTRRNILNQLKSIVGQGPLNQEAVNEIESLLLQADVGVEATDYIISALQKKLLAEVTPPEQAIAYLKEILRDILDAPLQNQDKPSFAPAKDTLTIWLITGVNGAGKTTTIGKISHLAHKSGYKCLIGAADTFRAAAVEQVKVWGERSGVEVIANPGKNTDPAAVVFDAIAAAQSRETELLLIDTAGRLQNKKNLMDELSKIRKIIDKKAPNARVESLLVLDSTLGQNGLRQAEVFSQAAQLSGVVLTKLDGTAKGGVALAVVQQLGLPIRFIGAGEGIEDLRPFSSHEFVEALLSD
ncbi:MULTISPECIES: signal recognition particle-docking protein FtsY [Nostocales]|uniref:signal recognition particle-docking protein FtsY n=1 Tax=Nostocales TaxID=1161 RepID=UPI00029B6984|nr:MULTISPECIES: signal recognition particle-docking protein FtsY [Nostocales]AFW95546.1 signal recognition particle-docking protein FtsY [Anabaena sp. 90]MTJ18543.1 signal recognition particle-docking protein FtsY [Dolichospermum sp. UHCC 0299]MTJ23135.1 signal recognition particle-docking protein FtsY [Dolichospermum sp. UHCC 0352]MTJ41221.1 signal recognition particle-docking protein FtsY [Dolichospermum sp. UHCC 0406]